MEMRAPTLARISVHADATCRLQGASSVYAAWRDIKEEETLDWLEWVQWPAMVVTVLASWLVGSNSKGRRNTGFWVFLLSNALWVLWGAHDDAYALITLQLALAAMNIRGMLKTEKG